MEGSLTEKDRHAFAVNARLNLKHASDCLRAAEKNFEIDEYKTSMNRSYYAAFAAMCACNALDGYSSSKHSGVIAHFRQYYIKTGIFSAELPGYITQLEKHRELSDYDLFFEGTREEAGQQLENAKRFFSAVNEYLKPRLKTD